MENNLKSIEMPFTGERFTPEVEGDIVLRLGPAEEKHASQDVGRLLDLDANDVVLRRDYVAKLDEAVTSFRSRASKPRLPECDCRRGGHRLSGLLVDNPKSYVHASERGDVEVAHCDHLRRPACNK